MSESYIEVAEGTGKKVSTQSLTINSQTVHLERSILGAGAVTLPGTAQLDAETSTGTYPATAVDIQGKFYLVFKNTFNDNAASAKYRIAFYDTGDVLIGVSEEITIENYGILDGSRYLGCNVVYSNDFCAESIKIMITELSASDNLTVFIGAI